MCTQSAFLLDALFCEEQERDFDETEDSHSEPTNTLPRVLLEQDMFWEDEELVSLFSKEQKTHTHLRMSFDVDEETEHALFLARTESVDWILRVSSHYGFSALTPILAVDYLDRFIYGLDYRRDKAWMIQLAAVACLSLAAKIEETHVPLLLDFQVEDAKYVFEAKTIERMEMVVLTKLEWRMNTVTSLSFVDHIIRRLGLKNNLHWEFFTRCESLLLSLLPDSRLVCYLPSVLATSAMLHVIREVEPCHADDYQNQLLSLLKINQEKLKDCYEVIKDLSSTNKMKRKYIDIIEDVDINVAISSPSSCVIDDPNFCCEESSDESCWGLVESSPCQQPLIKKTRIEELVI